MSLSMPHIPFFRSAGAAVLALVYTTLTFGAALSPTPVLAGEVTYRAQMTAPVEADRTVAGGIAWYCKGSTCVAGKGNSSPLRICRKLSKELGEISSFTAKGEVLAEEDLATCNGN